MKKEYEYNMNEVLTGVLYKWNDIMFQGEDHGTNCHEDVIVFFLHGSVCLYMLSVALELCVRVVFQQKINFINIE